MPLPYGARGQGACSWDGVLYVGGGYDGHTRRDFCRWTEEDRIDTGEIAPNAEDAGPVAPSLPADGSGSVM